MATKMPGGGAGRRVVARFDGANQSDGALRALQGAGLRPDQVNAAVYDPGTSAAAAGGISAGMVPILGLVLGALLGAFLGRTIVGGTTAVLLAAVVGAVAGALIATAIARAGAARASVPDPTRQRPGSVTLTVTADSTEQAQAARKALMSSGGREVPGGGGGQ